jgi:hypothetical protein
VCPLDGGGGVLFPLLSGTAYSRLSAKVCPVGK